MSVVYFEGEQAIAFQEVSELLEIERLKTALLVNAIKTHREQKADDRCIEDDDRLYEVLGDGIKCDRRVGDQCAMLENCKRFIANRTEGGGWPSYAELEKQRDDVIRLARLFLMWFEADGEPVDGFRFREQWKALNDCVGYEKWRAGLLAKK